MQRTFSWRWSVGLTAVAATLLTLLMMFPADAGKRVISVFIDEGDITLDGVLSDGEWPAESAVIDETGEPDVQVATAWCWTGTAWAESPTQEACVNSLYWAEEPQMDLQRAFFGTNATYMLLGFESAAPMMAALDTSTNEYVDLGTMYFQRGITILPQDYNHSMVFAFDNNVEDGAESYDYYLVAQLSMPQDLASLFGSFGPQEEGGSVGLFMFEDNNNEVGYQDGEETLLGEVDTSQSETSNPGDGSTTTVMEIKQDIVVFLEATGLQFGAEYGFRIETYSDVGDVSEQVRVSFTDTADVPDAPTGVTVTAVKKRAATVKWDAVDGAETYRVKLMNSNGKKLKVFKNIKKTRKSLDKGKLKKGREYQVSVAACNDAGCSDWSDAETFTTTQ